MRQATLFDSKTKEEKQIIVKDIQYSSSNLIFDSIEILLKEINKKYFSEYYNYLWNGLDSLLENFEIFGGSSKVLIDERCIKNYDPKIKNIDIFIPKDKLKSFYDFLQKFENKNLTPEYKYLGQTKSEFYGNEIKSFWNFKFEEENISYNLNFWGVEFDDVSDKPTIFAQFSRSNNYNDFVAGFNGIFHKYLLRSIVKIVSEDENVVILTPKSPETKTKLKIKKLKEIPSKLSFNVEKGIREKYRSIKNLKYEEKQCYKENEINNNEYITDPYNMFLMVFKKSTYNYDKFSSFVGLMQYIEDEFSEITITKIFNYCVELLFGKNAFELIYDDPTEDKEYKLKMVNYFYKSFKYLKEFEDTTLKKILDYYSGEIFK